MIHAEDLLSRGQAVVDALGKLEQLGLNRGSSGNISVRIDSRHFLISPSGVDKATLSADQMVLMSTDGKTMSGGKPSTEWLMHRDVYVNRPEVNAIVHTHSDNATALACAQKDIPPFHYMVAVTGSARIHCAPYALFGSQALSDNALAALKGSWACLLANHGVLAVHTSLEKALYVAQEVESLATQFIAASSIGQPRLLDAQQMRQVMTQFESYGLTAVPDPSAPQAIVETQHTNLLSDESDICTLRWVDSHLEMLDQRLLPTEIVMRSYRDAQSVAEGIKTMVVRGAPAIGVAAAYGMALEALRFAKASRTTLMQQLDSAYDVLANSRPTAVNLVWALQRMKAALDTFIAAHAQASSAESASHLLHNAQTLQAQDVADNMAMGRFGAALLPEQATILTHCNAGALATAGHGTALGVIRSAVQAGKNIQVYADETRPFLQGARLTAWELMQDKIPVTLLTDNASGWAMQKGLIDAVIVGADRIAANGDVANKIGTYMVAVLARQHGIPFYVAAPTSTIDMSLADGTHIPIEMRADDEVTGYGGQRWAPPGVKVFNPSFDVTPAGLVTAIITEKGVVHSPSSSGLNRLFE